MTKKLLLSLGILISMLSGRGWGEASVASRAKDELPFAQHLQKVLDALTDFKQGTGSQLPSSSLLSATELFCQERTFTPFHL